MAVPTEAAPRVLLASLCTSRRPDGATLTAPEGPMTIDDIYSV